MADTGEQRTQGGEFFRLVQGLVRMLDLGLDPLALGKIAEHADGAAVRGIELDSLEIETHDELDLRSFLGLSDKVVPGYRQISFTVHIRGNGTREQFDEIHQAVMKTSPNYFNMANPIAMNGKLELA